MPGFTLSLILFGLLAQTSFRPVGAIPVSHLESIPARSGRAAGFEVPFQRRKRTQNNDLDRRGTVSGSIGLGNNADLIYDVPIELGNTVAAVHLDTGSSDLWVISDACSSGTCGSAPASTTKVPTSSLNLSSASVTMRYGDSTTGTQASGPVAFDTATIAGLSMVQQPFAAINSTTSDIVKFGSSGIFGLGFPSSSVIAKAVVQQNAGSVTSDNMVSSFFQDGPLLSRIVSTGELEKPMFSISLQRSTIDIGGGSGTLTVGKLPDGVDESSITWVPVRLYSASEGGMAPPSFAANEVYPFRWEIDIDAVYLNGEKLANSSIATSGGVDGSRTSALVDTGNSLLRGPQDVVASVFSQIAPSFDSSLLQSGRAPVVPCATPIDLSFQIGGKMFPIDPRDMIGQNDNSATNCVADNLVVTDPPSKGALFRWSLGDPFFRSNLVVFHYGNLTHPSADPPKIGILSTVPSNADDLLTEAVDDAKANGGNFDSTLVAVPTAQAASEGQITLTNSRSASGAVAGPSVTASPSNNLSQPNSAIQKRTSMALLGLNIIYLLWFS